MGWETRLVTTLYFNRQTYDTLYKVENALEEIENSITFYENKLKSLVIITEPKNSVRRIRILYGGYKMKLKKY